MAHNCEFKCFRYFHGLGEDKCMIVHAFLKILCFEKRHVLIILIFMMWWFWWFSVMETTLLYFKNENFFYGFWGVTNIQINRRRSYLNIPTMKECDVRGGRRPYLNIPYLTYHVNNVILCVYIYSCVFMTTLGENF